MMTDLPGYATHGYCPNCYSITHEDCTPWECKHCFEEGTDYMSNGDWVCDECHDWLEP